MEDIIKFNGHSGCEIYLKKYPSGIPYVEKVGDVRRNIQRLWVLRMEGYPVPKVYVHSSNYFQMEYIHGLDIKTYLKHNTTKNLSKFIINILERFSQNSIDKDYTEIYHKKLEWLNDDHQFPFTKKELIDRLPKILPSSVYHGDMTLENLISTENEFYMIDPVTIEYDSYIFDIAKMRQDMECKWFLRNDNVKIDVKLRNLQQKILNKFPLANDDSILILMLLRVIVHCNKNDLNYNFIKTNIEKLWKNLN